VPLIALAVFQDKYLHQIQSAIATAEKAVEIAPRFFPTWATLHDAVLATGEKSRASSVLDRAAQVEGADADYWLGLGEYLRRQFFKEDGTTPEAELARMSRAFEKAVTLAPEDPAALVQAADFKVLVHQPAEALALYERAQKAHAQGRGEHPALENLREKIARSLIVLDRKAEAAKLLEQLYNERVDGVLRGDLPGILAELYEAIGTPERAIPILERSLREEPGELRHYIRLADAFLRLKNRDAAVEVMKNARRSFPEMPEVALALARTFRIAERWKESLPIYAEVEKTAKGPHAQLLDWEFYFDYGAGAERAGEWDRAAALLKRSIELDPNRPIALNYLGYMCVDRGENLDEAGKMIQRALELDPDNAAYLDSLGWYYYKVGRYEEAYQELTKAKRGLAEEESDPTVLDHLGDACEKLGRMDEALTHWKAALALDKTNEVIRKKIEKGSAR
jgi:tetratricopeptide (TPR) repeat protein